jgi:hypothetical protein
VINSSRSERGWRGRRRIAVLVSIAGVLGVALLGTAGTASAATVANCNAKLEPKGDANSTKAKLSFVCDAPVRTYSVGANKPIKNYGASSATVLSCEGAGVGFGCGVSDRAAPGTQPIGSTGWTAVPPFPAGGSNQNAKPLTCNGYQRVQGSGTPNPGPNLTNIVTGPCSQQIPAGTKVTQTIKFKSSPCAAGNDPLQLNLMVGGEPLVTAIIAGTSAGPGGESSTVGEYLQAPQPVSLKAYKHCSSGGGGGGAKKSAVPPTKFPVGCSGTVSPATTPGDSTLSFSCNQNIRAFAVYSNVPIDLPGDEPIVTGTAGGGTNEGALHQCEGTVPGPGYGCGIVDRQVQTNGFNSAGVQTGLPNGQGITAGNSVSQKMGFESTPCQRAGQAKPKVWLVAMGEPAIGSTIGEFSSAPQQLTLSGYGKCKGGKKK